jgi:hypothetical protein
MADLGEPAFERFRLGTWDGLDQTEDAFGVPAENPLGTAAGRELQSKGGYNLYPPFERLIQLHVTLAYSLEILRRIGRIGQDVDDVRDDEPPFVVVNGAADFLALEEGDMGFGVPGGVAHGSA